MTGLTRRELLCGLSLSAGAGALSVAALSRRSSAPASDSDSAGGAGFDPAVDGFGFDNYATPPVPPNPSEIVSERDLLRYLTAYWDAPLRSQMGVTPGDDGSRIRAVADQLSTNANRLFGTRGNCYGIASAAQWYFEEPTARPVDRDSTSEITHVDEPLEDRSSTPVRDDIERFHRSQFLDADSWLQRRALLRPESIDYRTQERDLRAAIDEFGSAGVTITGENVLRGHYVLLYDYDVTDTGVSFLAYDPNYAAGEYAETGEARVIGVDTTSYEPMLASYEEKYDRFLFSPVDRTVRARARAKMERDR